MSEKLLILERPEDRFRRVKVINAVKAAGGKIRHSSGRVFLLETLEKDEEIRRNLPEGTTILPTDQEIRTTLTDLEPSESILLDAIRLMNSSEYHAEKKRYRPGETPEEQELFLGPCIEE
jgi:hypothetical protein